MTTEQFHYKHDSKTITLPYMQHIKGGVIRRLRGKTPDEQLFGLLEELGDTKTIAICDEMTMRELGEMFQAWQEASQTSVGESAASASS